MKSLPQYSYILNIFFAHKKSSKPISGVVHFFSSPRLKLFSVSIDLSILDISECFCAGPMAENENYVPDLIFIFHLSNDVCVTLLISVINWLTLSCKSEIIMHSMIGAEMK